MTASKSASDFRAEAKALYADYVAMLVLTRTMTTEEYQSCKRTQASIDEAPREGIRDFRKVIGKESESLRRKFGITATREELQTLLREVERGEPGKICWVTTQTVSSLADFNKVVLGFDRLPRHARIGLSVARAFPGSNTPEIFLLEARLFEDMCAVFNLAKQTQFEPNSRPVPKSKLKTFEALLHSTVIAAFNLVEAYLNGIAADYLLGTKDLNEKTASVLTDWDHASGKPRYVSLRDKALQYPRIYLGLDLPPIQETNCPELKAFLAGSKDLRDSLVHASVLSIGESVSREFAFFQLSMLDVERLVDNSIALILTIEKTIGRNSVIMDWIRPRSPSGLFTNDVFE